MTIWQKAVSAAATADMGGMNQANMMKQAQKMQEELRKMQEELEASSFEATSGGGVVKAVVSGKHELTSLTMTPRRSIPRTSRCSRT